ncbi:filamentous hemagglutinin N-terminal domain-containing protein [Scytonema sp. PCC 10023]|uniref:two-partner secretion domain-containing protein n=1 Tax=Scytonema sp. PCC 10023 TaxID=1680591 RepID=UPI0039C74419
MSTRCGWFLGIAIGKATALWAIACVLPFSTSAVAQITPDSTLPNNSIVNINGKTFNITGGTQAGSNLFHSFKDFSVSTGSEAFFNNTVDIGNIISRVTGGSISNIDGLIRTVGTANLFLINPNGIIFGPNASLNIGGSFFASTAESLNFADGTKFSATAPQTTPLLTISVPLGLQFGASPASIRNQSQLQVQSGKSLALVGGNVSLDGGLLQALNGRVELAGVAGSGTVGLNLNGNDFSLSVPQDAARADVSLTNAAKVDVANTGQGSVAVTARNIDISGGSRISAGIKGSQPVGSSSRDVTLDATGVVRMIQDSQLNNVVESGATGNAGNININASKLEVNGGQIRTRTLGNGNAGNINIKAGEIRIDNPAYETNFANRTNPSNDKPAIDASAYSNNFTFGRGRSGNVSLEATNGSISLIGRGEQGENKVISTYNTNFGQGAGNVSLIAKGSISLDNAYITASTFSRLNGGGQILLQGDESVSLANNSSLVTTSFVSGNSGNITLKSSGPVFVQSSLVSTNVGSTANFVSPQGNAGDINISGRSVSITDGSEVRATSDLGGNSGKIEINATDAVEISGRLPVSLIGKSRGGSFLFSSLRTSAGRNATGKAGDININVPNGSLRIADGGNLRAETQGAFGGGNINVNAKVVELTGGGKLRTTTSSSGDAGNITFNNTDRITISGNISGFNEILNEVQNRDRRQAQSIRNEGYSDPSGVYANTSRTSTGKGGNVEITTGKLQVQDSGQINVSSDGQGNAGLLKITANSIFLDTQGKLQAATASGEGGNINLNVRDYILMRRQSQISAKADNNAKGGNITISSPNGFVVTVNNENSDIVATADQGQGGEITITSSGVYGFEISRFVTRDETLSEINALSQAGPQFNGTVLINNPNVDPSRGLVELPIVVADVSAPIDTGGCAAFAGLGGNQFIVTGRGGLPPSPYEPLSTDVVWLDTRISEITTQQQRSELPAAKPPSKPDAVAIVPATGWVFNGKGQVTLISHTSGANPSGSTPAKCPN